jgi:DNA sulfur modification protein DndD
VNTRKPSDKQHGLDESVKSLQAQRTDLTNRMMQLGAGAGDVASVSDVVKQQADAETELKVTEDALDDLVASKLPFHLVSRDLMDGLSKQVQEEIARDSWDSRKRSLEPEKAKFIGTFYATTAPPLVPELTVEQEAALQSRLNAAWESLFYPMPEGCAEVVVHSYLGPKRAALLQAMNGLRMGAQDVLGLVAKRESLQKKIRELVNRYTKIEGVDRDGSLAKLNGELTVVNATLDQRQRELGDIERLMSGLKGTIDQERALYAREHEKFVQANPVKSMVGPRRAGLQPHQRIDPAALCIQGGTAC